MTAGFNIRLPDAEIIRPSWPRGTPMAEVAASMAQLLADEPMATAAVFEPTPLDMLDIARLRHLHPEYADRLADAAGRQFDRETSRSAR